MGHTTGYFGTAFAFSALAGQVSGACCLHWSIPSQGGLVSSWCVWLLFCIQFKPWNFVAFKQQPKVDYVFPSKTANFSLFERIRDRGENQGKSSKECKESQGTERRVKKRDHRENILVMHRLFPESVSMFSTSNPMLNQIVSPALCFLLMIFLFHTPDPAEWVLHFYKVWL